MRSKVLVVVASMALMTSTFAAGQTWIGTVSDSICGAAHITSEHGRKVTDRDCTQACTSKGAQFVLVSRGTVYKLTNHDADLKTHVGHTVTLMGDLAGDTIQVSKIEMSKGAVRSSRQRLTDGEVWQAADQLMSAVNPSR